MSLQVEPNYAFGKSNNHGFVYVVSAGQTRLARLPMPSCHSCGNPNVRRSRTDTSFMPNAQNTKATEASSALTLRAQDSAKVLSDIDLDAEAANELSKPFWAETRPDGTMLLRQDLNSHSWLPPTIKLRLPKPPKNTEHDLGQHIQRANLLVAQNPRRTSSKESAAYDGSSMKRSQSTLDGALDNVNDVPQRELEFPSVTRDNGSDPSPQTEHSLPAESQEQSEPRDIKYIFRFVCKKCGNHRHQSKDCPAIEAWDMKGRTLANNEGQASKSTVIQTLSPSQHLPAVDKALALKKVPSADSGPSEKGTIVFNRGTAYLETALSTDTYVPRSSEASQPPRTDRELTMNVPFWPSSALERYRCRFCGGNYVYPTGQCLLGKKAMKDHCQLQKMLMSWRYCNFLEHDLVRIDRLRREKEIRRDYFLHVGTTEPKEYPYQVFDRAYAELSKEYRGPWKISKLENDSWKRLIDRMSNRQRRYEIYRSRKEMEIYGKRKARKAKGRQDADPRRLPIRGVPSTGFFYLCKICGDSEPNYKCLESSANSHLHNHLKIEAKKHHSKLINRQKHNILLSTPQLSLRRQNWIKRLYRVREKIGEDRMLHAVNRASGRPKKSRLKMYERIEESEILGQLERKMYKKIEEYDARMKDPG